MLIHNKKFCFRQINFKDNTFVYSQEFVQYKAKFLILNHKVFDSRVPSHNQQYPNPFLYIFLVPNVLKSLDNIAYCLHFLKHFSSKNIIDKSWTLSYKIFLNQGERVKEY